MTEVKFSPDGTLTVKSAPLPPEVLPPDKVMAAHRFGGMLTLWLLRIEQPQGPRIELKIGGQNPSNTVGLDELEDVGDTDLKLVLVGSGERETVGVPGVGA